MLMKTDVIAALLGGAALLAPTAAFAQDSTPAPAPTAPIDIPGASAANHVIFTPADLARLGTR